jgi:hypothetical protein
MANKRLLIETAEERTVPHHAAGAARVGASAGTGDVFYKRADEETAASEVRRSALVLSWKQARNPAAQLG